MLRIAHRINTIDQLHNIDNSYGIELDVRSVGDKLILHHDAFIDGQDFDSFLKHYKHSLIILNVKEEGLESRCLELMEKHGVKDYFFLDVSLPFLVRLSQKGLRDMAVRFSEYEPIHFVENFAGQVRWVWVDCFKSWPLDIDSYKILKEHFKICLVSPELQGHSTDLIEEWKKQLEGMEIDAVCTKVPEKW